MFPAWGRLAGFHVTLQAKGGGSVCVSNHLHLRLPNGPLSLPAITARQSETEPVTKKTLASVNQQQRQSSLQRAVADYILIDALISAQIVGLTQVVALRIQACDAPTFQVRASHRLNQQEIFSVAYSTDNPRPIHPGSFLRNELEALGLNAREFAEHIHAPHDAVTGIMSGDCLISAQMAIRLGQAFGTTPQYWLNLQAIYELKRALAEMPAEALQIKSCVTA